MDKPHRFQGLDSLRGIAATTVVIHHAMLVSPILLAANFHRITWAEPWAALLAYTPLHLVWAGHEAVVFFFVLSGFVLALPYARASAPAYGRFVVRRFFRIYVPYAAAVLVASVLLQAFQGVHGVPAFSSWFNSQWEKHLTVGSMARMLGMVRAPTQNFDTSTWSLVYEMRVSLVFPLLAWVAVRTRWFVAALVAIAMVVLSGDLGRAVVPDLGQTVYWAAYFLLGATLAVHREQATRGVRALPRRSIIGLAVVGAALYVWQWVVAPYLQLPAVLLRHVSAGVRADLATGLGSIIVMILALGLPAFDRALSWRPLLFLGRVSYSLYLIHPIVLLSAVYALRPVAPLWVPVVLTPGASLLAASAFHSWVERPAMSLGRALTRGPTPGRTTEAALPRS